MSLLAEVLSRIRQPHTSRAVPPNLKSIVRSSVLQSARRKKILMMAVLFAASAAAGLFSIQVIQSLTETSMSAPGAAETNEQGSRNSQVVINNEAASSVSAMDGRILIASAPGEESEINGRDEAFSGQITDEPEDSSLPAREDAPEDSAVQTSHAPSGAAEPAFSLHAPLRESRGHITSPDMSPPPFHDSSSGSAEINRYLYIAHTREGKKDFAGALEAYKKAIALDSRNALVFNSAAYVCLQMGRNSESVMYARQSLEAESDYIPALINLGIAHARLGNGEAAEAHLARALALEPDNQSALMNIAILNEKKGNLQKASDLYSRLIILGNAGGLSGLARVHETLGNTGEAINLYRRLSGLETADPALRLRARQRMILLLGSEK